jgi:hypothetical protein
MEGKVLLEEFTLNKVENVSWEGISIIYLNYVIKTQYCMEVVITNILCRGASSTFEDLSALILRHPMPFIIDKCVGTNPYILMQSLCEWDIVHKSEYLIYILFN